MNTKSQLNKIRTLLNLEVKLESAKLDNGAVLEAESFEAGSEVFVVSDEERVALPIGEYLTEDGLAILVQEVGVIAEVKEVSAEEEAPAEEPEKVEEEMETATPKKVVESVSTETFFSAIEELKKEIENLKLSASFKEFEEVQKQAEETNIELSKEDEVKGIVHTPEKSVEKKQQFLHSQNRKETTLDRVLKQLNK